MKLVDISGDAPKDAGPVNSPIEDLASYIVHVFALPALPMSQRFSILLNRTCKVLGMDYAYVTLPKEPVESVPFFSARMLVRPPQPGHITLTHLITRTRNLLHFDTPDDNPKPDYIDQSGKSPYRFIGAPIIFDGRVFGTIEMGGAKAGRSPISPSELMLVRVFSGLCAGTLVLLSD